MSHPRHVLCPAIFPSPAIFLKESGSSNSRGSDGCSGRNSVWITNRAALSARSIQCLSSTVMLMMLYMNPFIDSSVDTMSTDRESTFSIWIVDCFLSSLGVSIFVVSLDPLCPMIRLAVDFFIGLLPLH